MIGTSIRSAAFFAAFSALALLSAPSRAERLDAAIELAAKCQGSTSINPTLGAYKLLLSSKAVVREKMGHLTLYVAAADGNQGFRLGNLTPTRLALVEIQGYDKALVGSLYSADYPMADQAIIASYIGSLKRGIQLEPFKSPALEAAGIGYLMMSKEPVFESNYMMAGKSPSGDRFILCGTKQELAKVAKK